MELNINTIAIFEKQIYNVKLYLELAILAYIFTSHDTIMIVNQLHIIECSYSSMVCNSQNLKKSVSHIN